MIVANVYDSIGGNQKETVRDPQTYSHTISTGIGFDSMDVTFGVSETVIPKWLDEYLGHHIVVTDRVGIVVWEGFINQVSLSYGGITTTIGPVTEIVNKVKVAYQTVDYSIVFLPSESKETAYAEDATSQSDYFTIEQVVSASQATDTAAAYIRDTYLEQFATPKISNEISIGQGTAPSITVTCLGYYHLLNSYYYTDLTDAETNASTQIESILAADPNSIFTSVSTTNIETNTIQVPQYAPGDTYARSLIEEIVNYGDTSGNRWVFGVYENQIPEYRQVDQDRSDVDYFYDPSGPRLTDSDGVDVDPWLARPAKWAIITGILPVRYLPEQLSDDRRASFIEQVTFATPSTLTMSGGRINTTQQAIARLGIAGLQ